MEVNRTGSMSFNDKFDHLNQSMNQRISSLIERLDSMSQVSSTQTENILVLLKALETHSSQTIPLRQSRELNYTGKILQEDASACKTNSSNEMSQELLGSVQRLIELAKHKEGTKYSEEAQNIIDDLDRLLEYAIREISLSKSATNKSRKRSSCAVEVNGAADTRELKKARGHLMSSRIIGINRGSKVGASPLWGNF
jgi:hypothetical protein